MLVSLNGNDVRLRARRPALRDKGRSPKFFTITLDDIRNGLRNGNVNLKPGDVLTIIIGYVSSLRLTVEHER
jgi:hypothetical protein